MRHRGLIGWPVVLVSSTLLICGACAAPTNGALPAAAGPDSASVSVPDSTATTTTQTPTGVARFSEVPSAAPGTGTADQTSTAAALPNCSPAVLATHTPGVLTLATGRDVRPPWFTGPDPATSDGYAASVARDVAATLGYAADRVSWVQVDTPTVLAGSTSGFDVLIDRVREPAAGSDVLAFSTGYYSITDALLMQRAASDAMGGAAPNLASLRIGVIAGSSGQTAALERGLTPTVFDSSLSGLNALVGGSIDGLLLPTPDALAASDSIGTLAVVGQLAPGQWQPDQFHLVLARDSGLTPCVSAAVDRLRIEGTLDGLTQQWITAPLAPVIG